MTDVTILSLFGRGHGLAIDLASRGWKTELLDLTPAFASLTAADREGPFGQFEASDLTPTQLKRLQSDKASQVLPTGFSIWTREGILELGSSLTDFLLRARGVPEVVETYLRATSTGGKEADRAGRQAARLPFSQSWLGHLSHDLVSRAENENFEAARQGDPTPLFSKLRMREPSPTTDDQDLKTVSDAGVKVERVRAIEETDLQAKVLTGLNLRNENGERIESRSRVFVVLLNEPEMRDLNPQFAAILFEKPEAAPTTQWVRWQTRLKTLVDLNSLPRQQLVIDDVYLPWDRANFFLLRRVQNTDLFDVWVRVPQTLLQNNERLQKIEDEIKALIEKRLPETVCATSESLLRAAQSDPTRLQMWPRHLGLDQNDFQSSRAKNVYLCSREQSGSLDHLSLLRSQTQLLGKLDKIKARWDADFAHAERVKAKNLAREQAREKSRNDRNKGARP